MDVTALALLAGAASLLSGVIKVLYDRRKRNDVIQRGRITVGYESPEFYTPPGNETAHANKVNEKLGKEPLTLLAFLRTWLWPKR